MFLHMLEKRLNELTSSLCGLYTQKEAIEKSISEHKAIIGELQLQIKTFNEKCQGIKFDTTETFEMAKNMKPAEVPNV